MRDSLPRLGLRQRQIRLARPLHLRTLCAHRHAGDPVRSSTVCPLALAGLRPDSDPESDAFVAVSCRSTQDDPFSGRQERERPERADRGPDFLLVVVKRATWAYRSVAVAIVVAASLAYAATRHPGTGPRGPLLVPPPPPPRQPDGPRAAPPRLAHIFLIVDENRSYSEIVGNRRRPTINGAHPPLRPGDQLLGALFHPSLPNYIALTSGSNQGITDDRSRRAPATRSPLRTSPTASRPAVARWKEYAESMPSAALHLRLRRCTPRSTTPSSTTKTSSATRSGAARTSCRSRSWRQT